MSTPGNSNPLGNTSNAPTIAQFLLDYPNFDTSQNQDPQAVSFATNALQYWLNMATLLLNQSLWGNLYYLAVELFMAHNLALEAWAEQGGDQTIPGITKGCIAASASGDVSITYNNAAVLELNAGHWNFTTYGIRLKRLIEIIGAGPIQVTGACGLSSINGPAWEGPFTFNFPNPEQ